jgi:hypothetical protein
LRGSPGAVIVAETRHGFHLLRQIMEREGRSGAVFNARDGHKMSVAGAISYTIWGLLHLQAGISLA